MDGMQRYKVRRKMERKMETEESQQSLLLSDSLFPWRSDPTTTNCSPLGLG